MKHIAAIALFVASFLTAWLEPKEITAWAIVFSAAWLCFAMPEERR